ncbi:MAG: hypothetical protein SNJ51_20050, partial [Roseiflexus sp.]
KVRIAWDIPELRAHGPDVTVIPAIRERQNRSTFDVAVEGVRPARIVEITSPEVRALDVENKVEHYARAGGGAGCDCGRLGRDGCGWGLRGCSWG